MLTLADHMRALPTTVGNLYIELEYYKDNRSSSIVSTALAKFGCYDSKLVEGRVKLAGSLMDELKSWRATQFSKSIPIAKQGEAVSTSFQEHIRLIVVIEEYIQRNKLLTDESNGRLKPMFTSGPGNFNVILDKYSQQLTTIKKYLGETLGPETASLLDKLTSSQQQSDGIASRCRDGKGNIN